MCVRARATLCRHGDKQAHKRRRRTAVDAFLAGRQMHIVQRAQQRRELKPLPPLLAYVVGIVPCRIFTLRLFVCLRLLQHAALH
jgi:hypothetical protein